MKFFQKILIQPRSLLVIFLAVALIVLISSVFELIQTKKEILDLMQNQSHSLLETIIVSSQEVLMAGNEYEEEMNKRLTNTASVINLFYEKGNLNSEILKSIAETAGVQRINIFNKKGNLILSNYSLKEDSISSDYAKNMLQPLFEGVEETIIIGLKQARNKEGYRYVVAISGYNNSAIVLNLDAAELLSFRKKTGFGVLLNKLTNNKGVIYTALQDENGILAASGNVEGLETIDNSEFLSTSMYDSLFAWRFSEFSGGEIFEAVHPFVIDETIIGLLRIGLSTEPLNSAYDRITLRIIISGIFLILFGAVLLVLVFVRQNLTTIKKQYHSIESYSNNLIQNVSDSIIVLGENQEIKDLNKAAIELFSRHESEATGMKITELICPEAVTNIFGGKGKVFEAECEINGSNKILLVSRSEFMDAHEKLNYVLIVKDLTDIKELEKQIERNDRLVAMGHLASGVAHEIRNPLNTIGTIGQQLDRDFEPTNDSVQYHSLAKLIYTEVKRINRTIENFLKFSRPLPIKCELFNLNDLMKEIEIQYKQLLIENNIELRIQNTYKDEVNWDRDQIRQVLLNLIENARGAIKDNGLIDIAIKLVKGFISITVTDNGSGIAPENLERIFDLYFTTKAEGTGIGLSLTQKIINGHEGFIAVNSSPKEGTKFTIKIKPSL